MRLYESLVRRLYQVTTAVVTVMVEDNHRLPGRIITSVGRGVVDDNSDNNSGDDALVKKFAPISSYFVFEGCYGDDDGGDGGKLPACFRFAQTGCTHFF